MLPTLESLALARVRERFPAMQRKGLAKALRDLEPAELGGIRIHVVPDGWFIEEVPAPDGDGTLKVITCIEIEDRNTLTRDKLWHYCGLWFALDTCSHDLRLLVFDRYGFNEREIGLGELFLAGLMEQARLGYRSVRSGQRSGQRFFTSANEVCQRPKWTSICLTSTT